MVDEDSATVPLGFKFNASSTNTFMEKYCWALAAMTYVFVDLIRRLF